MLMGLLEGGGEPAPVEAGVACPRCGLTYADFRRVGRLGCGTCYETFGSELRPLLRRIHGSIEHTGCVPSGLAEDHLRRKEMMKLKRELSLAVQDEEYEKAATLRDAIRAAEAGTSSAEGRDVDARDNDE
jgi:protein arginine kinase activator